MIEEAALRAKRRIKLVDLSFQGKDHASLIAMSEALYLKVAYLKVEAN